MKKIFALFLFAITVSAAQAQTQTTIKPPNRNPIKPAASVSKSIPVAKDAIVVGYAKVISPGRLSLTKVFGESDGKALMVNYTLTMGSDPNFRKPVRIGLSKKSFDSVFTHGSAELASRYAVMNKYVTDNNISLDNEQGWVKVVKYYNNL